MAGAGARVRDPARQETRLIGRRVGPLDASKGPVDGSNGPLDRSKGPVDGSNGPLDGDSGPLDGDNGPLDGSNGPLDGSNGPLDGSNGPVYGDNGPVYGVQPMRTAYPGLMTSSMMASRSSKWMNADFIAFTVNRSRSAQP